MGGECALGLFALMCQQVRRAAFNQALADLLFVIAEMLGLLIGGCAKVSCLRGCLGLACARLGGIRPRTTARLCPMTLAGAWRPAKRKVVSAWGQYKQYRRFVKWGVIAIIAIITTVGEDGRLFYNGCGPANLAVCGDSALVGRSCLFARAATAANKTLVSLISSWMKQGCVVCRSSSFGVR